MDSVAAIFSAFNGVTAVADMLGLPLGTVSAWKSRESIPSQYWRKLVDAAARLKIAGVTYEALAKIAATRLEEVAAEDAA